MGFDKVKIRQICFLVLYAAVVILLLMYSSILFKGIGLGIRILTPILVGGAISFILNIPMKIIENKLFKWWDGKVAKVLKRPVSMILAIVFVLAVVVLVIRAVVPQFRETLTTLGKMVPMFWEDMLIWLNSLATDYPELKNLSSSLESFDWGSITTTVGGFLTNGVGTVLSSTLTVAGNIVSGITTGFISFIFAIYILSQKECLQRQAGDILDAYCRGKWNGRIKEVFSRLNKNFTNFICGQCLEAVIIALLFMVFMTIFQMPFVVMISTLIAFTSLIPIVGAFIGCGLGAFMIFIDNPMQALWFLVLFLVLQQLEGNLIYPKVVGNSVGLPPIWVLASVTVGGSLCGVLGMLVAIPLMSTLYSLLRDDVNQRLGKGNGRRRQERTPGKKREPRPQSAKRQDAKTQAAKQQNAKPQEAQKQETKQESPKQEVKKQEQKKNRNTQNKRNKQEKSENTETTVDSTTEELIARLVAEGEAKVLDELGEDPNKQEDAPKANKKKKYYYYRNKKRSR